MLEDLTAKSWPRYLLTVLNAPDFEAESTLKATAEKLDSYTNSLAVKKSDNTTETMDCMVMSTASYFGTGSNDFSDSNHNNAYPYATQLKTGDFYMSAAEAIENGKAVKIYVERLAAKVQLTIDQTLTNNAITVNGKKLYKLTQTVAGDPNNQENPSGAATTDLYLEIAGWDLSGLATKSHMSKILNSDWNNSTWNTLWNDANNFRSYWGKSALYGSEATAQTGTYDDCKAGKLDLGLWFTNFNTNNRPLTGADDFAYCNENTNTTDVILTTNAENQSAVKRTQVTHVVLKTYVCDVNGNRLDMISYHGVLYLKDAYKQYVLNAIQAGNLSNLNYFVKTEVDGANSYKQVDADFFETAGTNAGVKIQVKDTNVDLYEKQADGTYKNSAELSTEGEIRDLMSELVAKIDNYYAVYTTPATEYKDGMNVYYIPVEHAGNAGQSIENTAEGYYGVVRNHWYNLNITSFSHVGTGVFDPTEDLIPTNNEDIRYYLGVNINVLSWKIVSQNVPL